MLPTPVLLQAQEELLNYHGRGASLMELSHLSPEFKHLFKRCSTLFRELAAVPEEYEILFSHGGGQMQFSMVVLNLIALRPARKAQFVCTGRFSERAIQEAERYGNVEVLASSAEERYRSIPPFPAERVDPQASYLHITTNNTAIGTRWHEWPTYEAQVPLVGDMTSEMLSRPVDFRRFGLAYAGGQKNLSPSGLAVCIVRKSLLGHALEITPKLLNYSTLVQDESLTNTPNTFAIYIMRLVLEWVQEQGGVKEMATRAERRTAAVYQALERHAGFYVPHAHPQHRSTMNITFRLVDERLEPEFIAQAEAEGLYGLKGHIFLGGIRASLYNGMPIEGGFALAEFIQEFARRHG